LVNNWRVQVAEAKPDGDLMWDVVVFYTPIRCQKLVLV